MEITKVDLRGVEPGGPGWEEARAAVTASMLAHGCVVVAHDALGPEMRRALFGRALPELFALPVEAKQRTVYAVGQYRGYKGQVSGMAGESVRVAQACDAASVRELANLVWPQGNPEFCETIVSVARNLLKLTEMVETLTLEGLGVRGESIVRAHLAQPAHGLRLSHYGAPPDKETGISMLPHRDESMVTAIVQHEVEGLEVLLGDHGRWVAVPPEPDTVTFVAGYLFTLVTNGRVKPCEHRVRTPSNRERYAVLFRRRYQDGALVTVFGEFVDAEHPPMYRPVKYDEYSRFRHSEEGMKLDDPLQAFCGVQN